MRNKKKTKRTKPTDEIKKLAGINWSQLAQDRVNWRAMGEAFALQWA